MARKKASNNKVVVGNIREVSGKVMIAGGDIYAGYTVEQVSFLLKEITTSYRRKPFDGRCPYKGLEVFEEEDADLFFGRERLVDDLVSRVKESRTVFITGPSGSGKSSLVRAGLIHALKDAALRGSDRWLYETMKPGREPIKELSLAFSRLKGPDLTDYFLAHASEPDILHRCAESVLSGQKTQRFVLFIDQFEEVFTQISGEEERQAFIHMLAHAGTVENGRVIVLFAMRSDFVSNCATYPALNDLLSQEFRQIGAMQPEELVAAIALPAKEVGLPIEDELIARIINDMKGEPGALPLMQFALKELFEAGQAKGGATALTLKEYLEREGIQKMLARHADDTLNKLNENQQELARSIFSGLIEIGRGTTDTKRTALFDELVPANASSADVLAIVQKLADARLIITDEQAGKDTVTISHEKLIEAWPWLKKLVNENRDVIALQNEVASDAQEWDEHKRDPSYLYTGARLANAREQLETKILVLSGTAHEFVLAGQAQQRHSRTTRMIGLAVPIGLVIVGIIIFSFIFTANSANLAEQRLFAVNTQAALASTSESIAVTAQAAAKEAVNQAQISRAGELAAQAVTIRAHQPILSYLLGLEAFRASDSPRSRSILLDNINTRPQLLQYFIGHSRKVFSVAFSPDGKTLASGGDDDSIILWDIATGRPIGPPLMGHTDAIETVVFSPDGKMLASSSDDRTIILWDVATHQPIGQPLLERYSTIVLGLAFSPDGKMLASTGATVVLWDVATHQPIGPPLLEGHTEPILSVVFSPDGKTLAFCGYDKTIILWDIAAQKPIGKPLIGQTNVVSSVSFSPDGKLLASSSFDGTIVLWDIATHKSIEQPFKGHQAAVLNITFSPDGKRLASSDLNGIIFLWDVAEHMPINSFAGQTGPVNSVVFSPDGKMLASASDDKTIILWDVDLGGLIGLPLTVHTDGVRSVAFRPDGKMLASGSDDKTIILLDETTHQPIGQPLTGHTNGVRSVVFSPDGKMLVSGSDDKTIILWNVTTHQPIGQPLTGHTDGVRSVVFSQDGKMLASGSDDKTIILWNVTTHQPIGQPLTDYTNGVSSVAFSPDGKMLASGGSDGTILLWDVATRKPVGLPLEGHIGRVDSVAFSPDGKTLASGSADKTIILWDVVTHQPIGLPLAGHTFEVSSVAFSPDGEMLASGSQDNTVILWDVTTHQPISLPFRGRAGWVDSVAFSPDGKILAASGYDGTIILWNIDPQSWIGKTCQLIGRNFIFAEWAQYFPNEGYRKTCEQWPLEPEATPTPRSTP